MTVTADGSRLRQAHLQELSTESPASLDRQVSAVDYALPD
jgi:hypothetical protein